MTYCCVGIIWDATWWTRPSNHVEQTGCFFWHKYHRLFRVKIAVVLSLFWHKKHTEDCFCFLAGLPTGSLDYYYAMQVQLGKALLGFFFFLRCCLFEFIRKCLSVMIEQFSSYEQEERTFTFSGMAITIKIRSWKK